MNVKEAKMDKKEYKANRENMTHSSISYRLADDIAKATGLETRVTIPGHQQRGGSPSPYDRVLATRLGAYAANLISKNQYGMTVSFTNDKVMATPLAEVAGRLKTVPLNHNLLTTGRLIGINFGDMIDE